MITRYTCALNGVSLDSLAACIHITDVQELAPRQRIVTAKAPGDGLHVLRTCREQIAVRVSFIVYEYDTALRRSVLQKITNWAAPGGTLIIGDRTGQQLQVISQELPGLSALMWLDELTLTFTACMPPYWEDAEAVSAVTSDTAALTLPGSALPCPVSCTVTNLGSAPLTTLTLSCANTQMTFTRLSLPASGVFTLSMSDGLLAADADGVSAMLNRTDDSDDLLLAPGGDSCTVSVTADQAVSATFEARGRYL